MKDFKKYIVLTDDTGYRKGAVIDANPLLVADALKDKKRGKRLVSKKCLELFDEKNAAHKKLVADHKTAIEKEETKHQSILKEMEDKGIVLKPIK